MKEAKVLIVDDDDKNLKLMSVILKSEGYTFETAKNGIEALKKTEGFQPDLIYLDIMMPEMDGYEVLERLKENPQSRDIPVVMVTALADRESRLKGLNKGASDFITKPVDTTEMILRTKNLLGVKEFEDFLKGHNELLEQEVKRRTEELKSTLDELGASKERLRESYLDTIYRLTVVAEYKDEETAGHIKRTGYYCEHIAKNLGWSLEDAETIFYASPMHDIGKVAIPSEILLKPGKLISEEFALMKTHTIVGGRILNGSPSRILQMAQRIALTHHERWDAGGYPNGLKAEDIPFEGRVMHIADQYDALRSTRPYKPAFSHEKTVEIITKGDGRTMPSHFDPEIVKVFKDTHEAFAEIYEAHKEP
ncbi:MAG: response regulator [Nitrospirae bacterium]|nr:response regulator [Nitrospirota bacterium]